MSTRLSDGSLLFDDGELLAATTTERFRGGYLPLEEHPVYREYEAIPFAPYKEAFDLIPRDEWPERIAEMNAKGMWPKDHCAFEAYHQGSTYFCWNNCCAQAMSLCRTMQGLPFVAVSSASIGAPITRYRNRGGWTHDAVDYAIQHGAARNEIWPNNAISRRYDTREADADRDNFKILEAYKCPLESFDEVATAALRGHLTLCGFNWWRHAVMGGVRIVDLEGRDRWGHEIRNSWGDDWGSKNKHGVGGFGVLEVGGNRGRGVPDSVIVIAQVTAAKG